MITSLMQMTGLGRAAATAIVLLGLAALTGLGGWGALAAYRGIIADAVTFAVAARDASWKADIAAANAEVQAARAAQAQAVSRLEAQAAEQAAQFQSELNELEKANAALAGGDRCGLGRDRVRLLNGAR